MATEFSSEEIRIRGEELLAKVKELVHEGNVRRLIIKDDDGTTLIEVPLSVGVIGAVLLPVWAAIGAIAALATDCTIVVERRVPPPEQPPAD
jgi:hypothetical protein